MDSVTTFRTRLQLNGFALQKTSGKSMRPLIWEGQHCVAIAPLQGEPQVGDILIFQQKLNGAEKNIVHRLVEIRQSEGQTIYVTRGDNCLKCEYVRRSEIIGRVAEVHRLTGFRPWHAIPTKKFAVTDPIYLKYTRLWTATWPARRLYYLFRGHTRALCARVLSIFKKR